METQMQEQATTDEARVGRAQCRELLRDVALQNAMRKRAAGVPTYTVPEAAALLSLSQEYVYRLIHADAFPALRLRRGGGQGRYVVPAKAVEKLLDVASGAGNCVDVADWSEAWRTSAAGGAA